MKRLQKLENKYEKQLTDLKQRINLQEFEEKSLKSQLRDQKAELKQEIREKESQIKDLQIKVQNVTAEKDKTIDSLREQIEKMEEKYREMINGLQSNSLDHVQKLKDEYEAKLNDIKYLNEQEILSLKSQIRKLEEEIAMLTENDDLFEQSRNSEFGDDRTKVLDIRLSELHNKISDEMLVSEKQIAKLKCENEDANNKIESLKVTIEKLKATMNTRIAEKDEKYCKLKEKYNEKCEELQKLEGKSKDTLRLKKRITDLKVKISKLENIKRDLKESLKDRENELETQRLEKDRALIAERKKAKLKGDTILKLKKEMDQKDMELESIKRDFESDAGESGYFSPRGLGRKSKLEDDLISMGKNTAYSTRALRLDSPKNSKLNMTQNYGDSSTKLNSSKRLKSASPNRSIMSSTQRIRVGGLGRDRSARRLIQISTDHVNMYDDTHMHCNGGNKYCEACKYKTWRIQQLKYNPEGLLNNRDIIKYITCLGCDKAFEVKPFIKHCRDCRLSNQVPHIDGFKYWKNTDYSDSGIEDTEPDKKAVIENRDTIRSQNYNLRVRQTSTSQSRKDRILSTPLHSERMHSARSNPNLLTEDKGRKKLNRERINSQVYDDLNQSTNMNDFYEPIVDKSISAQKDNTRAKM